MMICGSRSFTDYALFKKCMDIVTSLDGIPKEFHVISGGCRGVDTLAEIWSKENNLNFRAYHAEWDMYGRAAGPMRNTIMVRNADIIVAFPKSSSTGTFDSMKKTKMFPEKRLIVFRL